MLYELLWDMFVSPPQVYADQPSPAATPIPKIKLVRPARVAAQPAIAGGCFYCNQPATCRDHLVPRAYTEAKSRVSNAGKVRNGYPTVPACTECNCILGSKMFGSVHARVAYLARRLRSRHRRLLRMPQWDEASLATLSFEMRQEVEATDRRRLLTAYRVAFCESLTLRAAE